MTGAPSTHARRTKRVAAARAKVRLQKRRRELPLMYARLWDNPEPRTSQKRALLPLALPDVLVLCILGGNRTGKSLVMAMWLVASALGEDFAVDTPRGKVYPVREWLRLNELPSDLIGKGPGEMWCASPNFSVAKGQIRTWIRRFCPTGCKYVRWDNPCEAEVIMPNGGKITSKAYKQFDQDPQTWEGANVRGIGLDEQPNSVENFRAALSRLIDQRGKMVQALTPLKGKNNWFYKEVACPKAMADNPDYQVVTLHGADNPHIPKTWWEKIMSKYPAWQRAARERGEFVSPEGAVYTVSIDLHMVDVFPVPASWSRFVGIDWGMRFPHIVWTALVQDPFVTPDGKKLIKGDLLVYREFAPRQGPTGPRFTTERIIQEGIKAEAAHAEGMRHATVYRVADSADPDAIEEAAGMGWNCAPARKGPGSIARGISLVEGRLQVVDPLTIDERTGELAEVRPSLYFQRCVPVLIEEMMGMMWQEGAEGEDAKPDETCPDHGPDALRYVIQYMEDEGFDALS